MSAASVRGLAARILDHVLEQGQSLATELPKAQAQLGDPRQYALLSELCYGVLRHLPELVSLRNKLLDKPLRKQDRLVDQLLLVGLYQLRHMRVAEHAAISETVSAVKPLNKPALRGLVNAVLRNYQRQADALAPALDAEQSKHHNHPGWLVKKLKAAYPEQWLEILEANNQRAPMDLRVNCQHFGREAYLAQLSAADINAAPVSLEQATSGIRLEKPCDVYTLPGFTDGHASVQDSAAQLAAHLLAPQPQERVLDSCAAPGGKTAHLLEIQPALSELVAVDLEPARLTRVKENLDRIGLDATLHAADAAKPDTWWDGKPFDRILCDAPCSATGVIRRHPDIRWLRRASDIEQLSDVQAEILRANWAMLKPGGTLLYATCSVMPEENQQQVARFLRETPDAELSPLRAGETAEQPGWQLLPGVDDCDGFYYARLVKRA